MILLFLSVFTVSCTKDIIFEIPDQDPKIVIEGWIEQGKAPVVIVTRSAPYFDPIDSATLANSIVADAIVTVSDGVNKDTLTLTINPLMYPFIMYTDTASMITGQEGRTYYLTVQAGGTEYTAQTTIPPVLVLDSVWFEPAVDETEYGSVYGKGTDPGATNDYYRVFTMRKNKDFAFIPILGSVWDDKVFNGQSFVFEMPRGFGSNVIPMSEEDMENFSLYRVGDTVITKLCHLDEISYFFWRAAESEVFSGGNPFSSTTSIPSNINGGGLGIWWGYGASYDTVICKTN